MTEYNRTNVLIVGAGPAGLAAAMKIKKLKPDLSVCVVDKSSEPGNHNLSGAALETQPLHQLLDDVSPGWQDSEQAKQLLDRKVKKDAVLMFWGTKAVIPMTPFLKIMKALRMGIGQMCHDDDYMVSISQLTKWFTELAKQNGVEVLHGFSVEDINLDESGKAESVTIREQGLDKQGHKQPNYVEPEKVFADAVILAEGCDGLVTESFIKKAGLTRSQPQLYSVGIKELIKVSDSQYQTFGPNTCLHVMGYPVWSPFIGPAMFGGGFAYAMPDKKIAVGVIVGADWKYADFNPQDALTHFKNTPYMQKFLADGQVVEAGAKMIPEGGYFAIPREPETDSIGRKNVLILGDSAGLVNMHKIKGLHNAIHSGILAAQALAQNFTNPDHIAEEYTVALENSDIKKEMYSARNFRQTFAKLGPTFGMPFSTISPILPKFTIEPDYKHMKQKKYRFKSNREFDKDTFTAMADTEHREEQPSHLSILDPQICIEKCTPKFGRPCITFCPAGVYETIHDQVKPANPSNCLHCKTCQRKCPYDNIRWTVPEGTGGPRYKNL